MTLPAPRLAHRPRWVAKSVRLVRRLLFFVAVAGALVVLVHAGTCRVVHATHAHGRPSHEAMAPHFPDAPDQPTMGALLIALMIVLSISGTQRDAAGEAHADPSTHAHPGPAPPHPRPCSVRLARLSVLRC